MGNEFRVQTDRTESAAETMERLSGKVRNMASEVSGKASSLALSGQSGSMMRENLRRISRRMEKVSGHLKNCGSALEEISAMYESCENKILGQMESGGASTQPSGLGGKDIVLEAKPIVDLWHKTEVIIRHLPLVGPDAVIRIIPPRIVVGPDRKPKIMIVQPVPHPHGPKPVPHPHGPHPGPRPHGPNPGPRPHGPKPVPHPHGPNPGPRSHGPLCPKPAPHVKDPGLQYPRLKDLILPQQPAELRERMKRIHHTVGPNPGPRLDPSRHAEETVRRMKEAAVAHDEAAAQHMTAQMLTLSPVRQVTQIVGVSSRSTTPKVRSAVLAVNAK